MNGRCVGKGLIFWIINEGKSMPELRLNPVSVTGLLILFSNWRNSNLPLHLYHIQ